MGTTELLFINALSANCDRVRYETAAAQLLIAQRLDVSLAGVSRAWTEIDMSVVQEIAELPPDSDHAHGLPSVAEVLSLLITAAAKRLRLQSSQLHCVVVLPAIGHVAALRRVTIEASRLTDQCLTAVIVLWREDAGSLRLFHVIPEPDDDDHFSAALQQTRACHSEDGPRSC